MTWLAKKCVKTSEDYYSTLGEIMLRKPYKSSDCCCLLKHFSLPLFHLLYCLMSSITEFSDI